jgi:hypothetical protein
MGQDFPARSGQSSGFSRLALVGSNAWCSIVSFPSSCVLLPELLSMKPISKRLDARVAASAVVAAAASAVGADAGLVHSGQVNIAVPASTTGVYINLLTGASGTSESAAVGWHINPWGSASLRIGTNTPTPETRFIGLSPATSTSLGGRVASLEVGSTISSSSQPSSMSSDYGWSYNDFSSGEAIVGTATGNMRLNADNYIGVLGWQSPTECFIGWVRIGVGNSITSRTVKEWFLSTGTASAPPAPITVGAIPAPGAIALLGVAATVAARRRRG